MKFLPLRPLGFLGLGLFLAFSAHAFNNDGKPDILWRHYGTGDNAAWMMNGTTTSSSAPLSAVTDLNWKMVGTGDFNRDGQLDILWRNTSNGQNSVWFMNGTTVVSTAYLETAPDTNWEIVGTGYFRNGAATDTSVDIFWRHKTLGLNLIWIMDGTTRASNYALPDNTDLNWKIGAVGDISGDGHPDLIWRNTSTGANAIWYLGASGYLSATTFTSNLDLNWEIVGAGHFNAGNALDLLWRNKATGDNAYWYMNSATVVGTALLSAVTDLNWKVGGVGDSKVDADGDGLPDLWEQIYLGTLAYGANDDPDSDGYTNLQEYQNGLRPELPELRVMISRPINGSSLP